MLRRSLPLALVLLTFACQPPGLRTRSNGRAIIGGTTDNGDPAVVALLASSAQGQALCSSEIVAPNVLLTAAHCVAPSETGPNAQFDVVQGTDISAGPTGQIVVMSTHYDMMFDSNNPQNGHDVGIVVLSTPINGITPLPYNRSPMQQTMVGQNARLVGYGLDNPTQQTGAGIKRQVTTVLDDFDNILLHIGTTGHDSCSGDSGGPALMMINGVETIVGVTSFGDQTCNGGGYYTRIDDYVGFINQYVTGMPCQPMCAGRTCGGDTCGGLCGTCGSNQTCTTSGQCMMVCVPQCNGKMCGDNGCGGTCGFCGTGQMCTPQQTCVSTNACERAGGLETEPNDTQMQAGVLCNDFNIKASISTPDDVDFFTWQVPMDQQYTVHLTGLAHDTEMNLLKVLNNQTEWIAVGQNNHDNADQAISLHSETGGTYYLMVRGVNGGYDQNGTHYQVAVSFP